MCKEERDVLRRGDKEKDECNMEKFGTLDSKRENDRHPRR